MPLAGAALAYGLAVPLGGSGFIAAFVGGFVFGAAPRTPRGRSGTSSRRSAAFGAVTFVVFGAVLLGPALDMLTWAVAVYAVLSLTVVRMAPGGGLAARHRRRADGRRSSAGSVHAGSRRSSS